MSYGTMLHNSVHCTQSLFETFQSVTSVVVFLTLQDTYLVKWLHLNIPPTLLCRFLSVFLFLVFSDCDSFNSLKNKVLPPISNVVVYEGLLIFIRKLYRFYFFFIHFQNDSRASHLLIPYLKHYVARFVIYLFLLRLRP